MENSDIKKTSKGHRNLAKEIATRETDPNFYGALAVLPNPDPILRKLGKTQEVFDAIAADAHVMGERRSIRSALLGFEHRLQVGGDDTASITALELCQQVMANRPAPGLRWPDVIWNKAQAIFKGHAVHEVVWKRFGNYLLPDKVVDRPTQRFVFGTDNQLRIKTRSNRINGEELGDYKWLVTRHMPSHDNPYGEALFSSCFWPYTFKHSGFKFFTKFCEKYGMPWAIGKYPMGTPEKDQKELVEALQNMVEDAVAAVPDNGSVELLSTKSSGILPQERLIMMCNSEMSKALTSQTLATEIQGEGSRAASETHREREKGVNESDREIICDSFNQLFQWITEINVPGATPPTFDFYQEEEARKEWVEVFEGARKYIDIPAQFAHNRLQIPVAKDGEDVLPRGEAKIATNPPEFSACPGCGHQHEFAEGDDIVTRLANQASAGADEIIESMAEPVRELLDHSESLEAFRDGLIELYPKMDTQRLGEYTSLAIMTGLLQGMDDA
jgi:phage gp29-like protein